MGYPSKGRPGSEVGFGCTTVVDAGFSGVDEEQAV